MNPFKKYMKVKGPDKAHAVLSASGSERWLGCPASVRLSKGITSVDNEFGIRGTNTHTLIQFILENDNWEKLLKSKDAVKFKKFIEYDDEMLMSAMFAVDFVNHERKRMFKETGHHPQLYVEQKLELKGVGFGTSDIILYQPFGVLHVMDYKNGRFTVDPEDNTQGLYYAHAAADKFGWDFSEIWITIIQPNDTSKRGPIRTWKTTSERLDKAGSVFRIGAHKTRKPDAPIVPDSKYCWFCPARPVCPAQMKIKEKNIMEKFEKPLTKNFCEMY